MDPLNKDISYRDTVIKNLRERLKALVEKNKCESKQVLSFLMKYKTPPMPIEQYKEEAESCHCETCLANHALATTSGWE